VRGRTEVSGSHPPALDSLRRRRSEADRYKNRGFVFARYRSSFPRKVDRRSYDGVVKEYTPIPEWSTTPNQFGLAEWITKGGENSLRFQGVRLDGHYVYDITIQNQSTPQLNQILIQLLDLQGAKIRALDRPSSPTTTTQTPASTGGA
jgi:hypothetical protein